MAAEPAGDFVELGEVIGGYRLERLLGAGSTSQVFLGKHVVLGRRAAIKVLVHKLLGNEDVISRLLTEAKVVNDIRHPNLIDISDFINTTSPRRVALVMEYIEGPSLTICREHPLTFEQAIGVMLQLVAAVRAAHAAGIIHRDIKPDNLLLTMDPREHPDEVPTLKVVDFGIAKMAHSNLAQTAVGTMLGTPAYMAPEQIAGRPRPSAATDVFAIGEVLYEILSGKRAYPAGTISETVRAKLRGELPDLKLSPMPGDRALLDLVKRCLSYRPEDRPGLQEIQSVLESVRPSGERVTTLEDVDLDASEVETRMVGHQPVPPAATELTPMLGGRIPAWDTGAADATPLDGSPVPNQTRIERPPDFDPVLTEANPIPRPRRFLKDITSPTNRVLPALTEIASFSDRPPRSEMPNAPTMPGSLNRRELDPGQARVVRDEQSLSIGELRIDNLSSRASDDEASVQIEDVELSQLHGSPQAVLFDEEDPLRIAPPPRTRPSSEELPPVDDPAFERDSPIHLDGGRALPGLGLGQPAGLATFDRSAELDALDADDLDEPDEPAASNVPQPRKHSDDAATMPPQKAPGAGPQASERADSGPDVPDTRITEVRPQRRTQSGSNAFFYVLLLMIGAGTAFALLVATGRIDFFGPAPTEPKEAPREAPIEKTEPTAEAKPGLFKISSEPTHADVMHVSEDPDSEPLPLGKTPLDLQLDGRTWPQTLRIVLPEYEPIEVEVTPENPIVTVTLHHR